MDVGHVVGDTYGAKIGVRAGVVPQRMAGLDPTLERAAIVVGLHAGPVDETPYPRDAVTFERREQTLVDLVTSAALRLRGSRSRRPPTGMHGSMSSWLGRPISGSSFVRGPRHRPPRPRHPGDGNLRGRGSEVRATPVATADPRSRAGVACPIPRPRDRATEAMMGMAKIDIAALEAAYHTG